MGPSQEPAGPASGAAAMAESGGPSVPKSLALLPVSEISLSEVVLGNRSHVGSKNTGW